MKWLTPGVFLVLVTVTMVAAPIPGDAKREIQKICGNSHITDAAGNHGHMLFCRKLEKDLTHTRSLYDTISLTSWCPETQENARIWRRKSKAWPQHRHLTRRTTCKIKEVCSTWLDCHHTFALLPDRRLTCSHLLMVNYHFCLQRTLVKTQDTIREAKKPRKNPRNVS